MTQNDQQPPIIELSEEIFSLDFSKRDLDLIFKFLSRSDIKGFEIQEFNHILDILNPSKLKKKNQT